jgi:zinc protease
MSALSLKTEATGTSTSGRIRSVTSAKGITAWLVEDYTVPLVAIEVAIVGGTSQEAADKAGSLTMMTGLLDEGAGSMTSQQFQERLEETAIELSANAGKEAIRASLRTLTRNLDEAFTLLGLALNEPRFDADAIERVRSQLISGMKRDEFDPDSMASRRWFELAFPGHSYGREDRGTQKTVAALTRSDLVEAKNRLFTRDSLRIAVVGAINAEQLAVQLDKVFGGMPASGTRLPTAIMAPQMLGTLDVTTLDVPQSTIRFGMPGPRRKDPDFIAKFIINHILGGGVFQARLFKEVREKRGLAYSVSSGLHAMPLSGMVFGGTATKNERAKESLDVIREEIAKLAMHGPEADELSKAKSYLTGSYALRFDTSSKIANQLLQLQLDELGMDYPDRRNSEIEAVDLAVAKQAAHDLLSGGNMLVTVVGKPVGLE